MDILAIVKSTLTGLFPLFAISLSGIFLTYKKVLDYSTNAKISECLANFLSPILCLISISGSFKITNLSFHFNNYILWNRLY